MLDLMGTDPDVRPLVLNYLHGRLPGVGLTFVNRVAGSILVGKQRLRLATAVNALMAAVDVAGNAIALQVFNRGLFASGLASSAAAAIGAVLLVPMSVGLAAVRTPPRPFSVQSAWTDYDNDSETNSYQAASGDAGSLVGSPSASVTAEGPDSAPPSFSVAGFLRSSANMIIRSILLQGKSWANSEIREHKAYPNFPPSTPPHLKRASGHNRPALDASHLLKRNCRCRRCCIHAVGCSIPDRSRRTGRTPGCGPALELGDCEPHVLLG